MTVLYGPDVSSNQPQNILSKIKYDFAIVKMSGNPQGYTWNYVNPYAAQQCKDAYDKTGLIGLYHFTYGLEDAKKEADFFVNEVKKLGYLNKAVLVIDYEGNGALNRGRNWVKTFADRIKEKAGYAPVIYASGSVIITQNLMSLGYPMWCANYYKGYDSIKGYNTNGMKIYGGCEKSVLWQYTSQGYINGYDGPLDCNVFYGTKEDWKKLAGTKTTPSKTTPAETTTTVPYGARKFKNSCKEQYEWWKNATAAQRNNGKRYWGEFTNNWQSWCSEFVGWNLKHIGLVEGKTMPSNPTYAKRYYDFFTNHPKLGTVHNLDEKYKPQVGDIILQIGSDMNKKNFVHTEMVGKVDGNTYWSYSGGSSVSYSKHTTGDKRRYWFITINWDKVLPKPEKKVTPKPTPAPTPAPKPTPTPAPEPKPTPAPTPAPEKKSLRAIAKEVLAGKWDSGVKRIALLKKAGYDPNKVQEKVNDILYTRVAKEVIAGKWGTGETRKAKLKKAGWDYKKVQEKVNELV